MPSFYEIICQRRTIRKFQQQPIQQNKLIKLIDAARLAPSGANIQPCEYVVVSDAALCEQVFPLLKWAAYIAPDGDPRPDERPVSYIVVLVDTERKARGYEKDAAAGIMNIILCAGAMQIGSCWLGSIDRPGLMSLLQVPDRYQIDSVIALGYPAESPVVETAAESIRYWKDAEGVLHVPKRPMEAVLHHNVFSEPDREV